MFVSKPWFWPVAHLPDPVLCIKAESSSQRPRFDSIPVLCCMSCLYTLPFLILSSYHKIKQKKGSRPWFKILYHTQALGRPDNLCSLTWTQGWPRGCSTFLYEKTQKDIERRMPSPGWFLQYWFHCFHCIKTQYTDSVCTKQPVIYLFFLPLRQHCIKQLVRRAAGREQTSLIRTDQ